MAAVRLSFTGTRQGMTKEQVNFVEGWLRGMRPDIVRHGGCIGADEQFHYIVRRELPRTPILVHPGTKPDKRAVIARSAFVTVCFPDDEMKRNDFIAEECDILLACPAQEVEVVRSGTWATIRRGRRLRREVVVVSPRGFLR